MADGWPINLNHRFSLKTINFIRLSSSGCGNGPCGCFIDHQYLYGLRRCICIQNTAVPCLLTVNLLLLCAKAAIWQQKCLVSVLALYSVQHCGRFTASLPVGIKYTLSHPLYVFYITYCANAQGIMQPETTWIFVDSSGVKLLVSQYNYNSSLSTNEFIYAKVLYGITHYREPYIPSGCLCHWRILALHVLSTLIVFPSREMSKAQNYFQRKVIRI